MQESLTSIPISAPTRAARPPQEGVPRTKGERDRLLAAIQQYVRTNAPVPPLSLAELKTHTEAIIEITGLGGDCADFITVLMNNEVWREQLAGIGYDRRLLLLPKCLRDADNCAGEIDEVGLVCRRCGRCSIRDLQAEAERLGYVVLIAEGSPVVMGLLETNQVEAVVGVSCLAVLREVFPYMHAAAVPGMAVPLLCDGCRDTAVDLDWVWELMHLTSDDKTRRLNLEDLRRDVEGWFQADCLDEVLGPAQSETERIARQWLGRSGKRWRPFLAVCAYKALRDDFGQAVPDDLRKLAVAVECFHKASLIHDDIEDGDQTRYDQETLHAEYGVAVALNVGDLLLGEGYRLVAEIGTSSGRKVEMLRTAAEGHRMLCIGQGIELCWARSPRPLSSDEVLDIFRRKTAPAFDVALHLGAMYAGAGENVWDVLDNYSRALGIAYQIRDDLDDFASGPDGGDVGAARPSILLAIAHESAGGDARGRIEDLWRRKAGCRQMTDELRSAFDEADVIGRTRQLLESYKQLAVRSLSPLDNANLKGLLRRVVTKIFNDAEVMFCCNDYQSRNARSRRPGEDAAG
ncbi:MAG: polyprenyl synthetase family protein [Phycisphaerae bacterium]